MAVTRADVLAYLEESNMVEISELINEIEEKFGVTAAAPVAAAAAALGRPIQGVVARPADDPRSVAPARRRRGRRAQGPRRRRQRRRHQQPPAQGQVVGGRLQADRQD